MPAGAPEDALRPGGDGDRVPVRGQGSIAQRQPGHPARRRPGRRRDRGPADPAGPGGRPAARTEPLLVEEYVPGPELSIDGLLTDGGLAVTAIFDKPAPRTAPPSRKPC